MTHGEKQIHNAVHAELREFEEFKELVKRKVVFLEWAKNNGKWEEISNKI